MANLIKKEINHFYKLRTSARKLLSSYILIGVASSALLTFIDAYIWRDTNDAVAVALFNLAFFIVLPVGFYINGLLLKRFLIGSLYRGGLIIIGLTITLLIFYSRCTYPFVIVYGFVYGLGQAFYWANRNCLTLEKTRDSDRNYFSGLELSVDTLINIVFPALIGWMIVLGQRFDLYSIKVSYLILAIVGMYLLVKAGNIVVKERYNNPKIGSLRIAHMTLKWNGVRAVKVALGLTEGAAYFFPTLLVFTHLGSEEIFGMLSSLTSILVAAAAYLFGRLVKSQNRIAGLNIAVIGYVLAAFVLAFLDPPYAQVFFILISSVSSIIMWTATNSLIMDIIDLESSKDDNYAYLYDRELYLNLGRIMGVVIFIILYKIVLSEDAIKYTPLFLSFLQAIAVMISGFLFARNERNRTQGS
ncbi:MAG: MFS transporter [Patescibacteria group bacterium]|nr:MFS transporter [Patescibacteria group bacterium]